MKKILLMLLFLSISLFAAVNINTASAKELSKLKGIGAKKATAIVEYREANGAFKSINELTKVKGMGKKSVEKLKEEIVVE